MKRLVVRGLHLAAGCIVAASLSSTEAGVVVYEEGDKKVEVGGRVQIQYLQTSPDGGESLDEIFLRRLRPYIQASVTKNWVGKIEFDFGENLDADEVEVKDAYMLWTKHEDHRLFWGNSKTTFAREFLTSSTRLELVERTFTGDHNFGTPDRMLGLRVDNGALDERLTYQFSLGAEHHDPGFQRIDFDSPVSHEADWNEGVVAAARVDFDPRGHMPLQAADFHTEEFKYGFGAGGYYWTNDDDNNTYTDAAGTSLDPTRADLDEASGYEVAFYLRGRGLSADLAYQGIHGETVATGFTGGLYLDGETDLDKSSVTVGYMLPTTTVEIVVGWDALDASNYQTTWTATIFGVNYYLDKHNLKVQGNYRMGKDVFGVSGDDLDTVQIQTQFVF